MVLYRMYAKIKFNRPLRKTEFISPGGYEFVMNGKTVTFDFLDYMRIVDDNEPSIISCELKIPDDGYADTKSITLEDLKNINSINDFYIHFEDKSLITQIISITFEALNNAGTPTETIETISVPQKVIEEYNNKHLAYTECLIKKQYLDDPIYRDVQIMEDN